MRGVVCGVCGVVMMNDGGGWWVVGDDDDIIEYSTIRYICVQRTPLTSNGNPTKTERGHEKQMKRLLIAETGRTGGNELKTANDTTHMTVSTPSQQSRHGGHNVEEPVGGKQCSNKCVIGKPHHPHGEQQHMTT